jgi:hypothetical protein
MPGAFRLLDRGNSGLRRPAQSGVAARSRSRPPSPGSRPRGQDGRASAGTTLEPRTRSRCTPPRRRRRPVERMILNPMMGVARCPRHLHPRRPGTSPDGTRVLLVRGGVKESLGATGCCSPPWPLQGCARCACSGTGPADHHGGVGHLYDPRSHWGSLGGVG